ncbi:MAG: hypothetical protein KBS39_00140, partial [Lachnospiraceae bacterium]|nr:hypothetical protein [Candidatus Hippenecus merdae]
SVITVRLPDLMAMIIAQTAVKRTKKRKNAEFVVKTAQDRITNICIFSQYSSIKHYDKVIK